MTSTTAPKKSVQVEEAVLSDLSAKYDINGDGELDEAEQAMRNMDQTGRGYLTNDKVYGLMQEHLEMQKGMFKLKKVIGFLVVLVLILAVANLGTSFAAAILAKDTTTNEKQVMVNKADGEAVGTQTAADVYEAYEPSEQTARRLCGAAGGGGIECSVASFSTMSATNAKNMLKKCAQDKTVRLLKGTFKRTVCHDSWTCTSNFNSQSKPTSGVLCIENSSEEIHVYEDPKDSSRYILSGDANVYESSDYLHMCMDDVDCEDGEVCTGGAPQAIPFPLPAEECDPDGSDCDGHCHLSLADESTYICSPCNPDAPNGGGCDTDDARPACIANGAGGYSCGCDVTASSNGCGSGVCASPICVPDVLPYCSTGDHSSEWNCGSCSPAVALAPPTEVTPTDPVFCPEDYTPVCGNDSVTYSNACHAEAAGVLVYTDGECRSTVKPESATTEAPLLCSTHYDPVCVTDGGENTEYTNDCFAGLDGWTDADWEAGACPRTVDPTIP